jgi:two-component sensor histidine kinase
VTINWSRVPAGKANEADEFLFEWHEQGGPGVQQTTSTGFGRKVLEQLVSLALEGRATLIFHPSGVRWTLFAPATAILADKAG